MPICECAEFPISLDLRLQKYKNAHKEHLQYLCGYMKSKNKVNTKASKKKKKIKKKIKKKKKKKISYT